MMDRDILFCEDCSSKVFVLDEKTPLYYCPICQQDKSVALTTLKVDSSTSSVSNESSVGVEALSINDFSGDTYIVGSGDQKQIPSSESTSSESTSLFSDVDDLFKKDFDLPYPGLVDARRRIIPRQNKAEEKRVKAKRRSILISGLLAFLILLLGSSVFLVWRYQQQNHLSASQPLAPESASDWSVKPADFKLAEQAAKNFLAQDSWMSALELSIPDSGLEQVMQQHWKLFHKDPELKLILVDYISGTEYVAFYFHHIISPKVKRKVLIYMNHKRECYFDWRSYEGVQDVEILSLPRQRVNVLYAVRSKVRVNNYYNFGYKEGEWQSYMLHNPNRSGDSDEWVNAYAELSVSEKLQESSNEGEQRLLLKVKWTGNAAEIIDVISTTPAEYSFLNSDLFHE